MVSCSGGNPGWLIWFSAPVAKANYLPACLWGHNVGYKLIMTVMSRTGRRRVKWQCLLQLTSIQTEIGTQASTQTKKLSLGALFPTGLEILRASGISSFYWVIPTSLCLSKLLSLLWKAAQGCLFLEAFPDYTPPSQPPTPCPSHAPPTHTHTQGLHPLNWVPMTCPGLLFRMHIHLQSSDQRLWVSSTAPSPAEHIKKCTIVTCWSTDSSSSHWRKGKPTCVPHTSTPGGSAESSWQVASRVRRPEVNRFWRAPH